MGRQPISGYCHTCRKRRIKCDKQGPECMRCIKAGFKCGGYELPLRIESYGLVPQSDGQSLFRKIVAATSFPLKPEQRPLAIRDGTAIDFLLQSHWEINFLGPVSHKYASGELGEVAEECYCALRLGLLANEYGDADMKIRARCLYGKQLGRLSELLDSQKSADIAPLIGSVMILGTYTLIVEKDMENVHHDEGLATILEHCGPAAYQSPTNLTLFECSRALLISRALMMRKRTFLEQAEWTKVPWKTQEKGDLQYLLDIMVHIPGLLEDTDTGRHFGKISSKQFQARVDGLKQRLENWRLDWVAQHPNNPVGEVQHSSPRYTVDVPFFQLFDGSKPRYENAQLVVEVVTYGAVFSWLGKLESIIYQAGSPENQLHP